MQTNLFSTEPRNKELPITLNNLEELEKISGLVYVPYYLTKAEELALWESITTSDWQNDIKRRVQHYGWKYDYRNRFIDYSSFLGQLPLWSLELANRLFKDGHLSKLPDQLIVNEYLPGQGIANHVDCEPCFEDTVISISLGSYCIMDFIHLKSKTKIEALLEPRSLAVIKGSARYEWSHGISARKTDIFKTYKIDRTLRISLTFRNVITNGKFSKTI